MNKILEVVIKIPKGTYDYIIQRSKAVDEDLDYLETLISYGTVLPKNHGRLIDADKIKYFESSLVPHIYSDIVVRKEFIDAMPTILDAEVENEFKRPD